MVLNQPNYTWHQAVIQTIHQQVDFKKFHIPNMQSLFWRFGDKKGFWPSAFGAGASTLTDTLSDLFCPAVSVTVSSKV